MAESQVTGEELVTNVSTLGARTFSLPTSLANVFPVLHDGAPRTYRGSSILPLHWLRETFLQIGGESPLVLADTASTLKAQPHYYKAAPGSG